MQIRNISAAILIAVLTLGGVAQVDTAAARELRYAEFGPNRGTRAQALDWFNQQLAERSGGDLKLRLIWGGARCSTPRTPSRG